MTRRTLRRFRGAAVSALALLALTMAGCAGEAGAWRLIGPDDGAHVYTIVADPHVAGLIYAGADNGAVYRGLADQSGHVAPGAGIPHDAAVASILPDPLHAGVVFAGTSAGLYRSDHYGDQWSAYGAGLPTQAAAVALAATPDDATALAGEDHGGLYRSLDDGAHWTPANGGLPAQSTPVALQWDSADHLWLLGLNNANGPALFASGDNGQTWTARATGLSTGAQVNALALLSGASSALFAATSQGLYTSADAGQHWSHTTGLPDGGALALATLPQQPTWLYVAVGATIERSTDAGAHWQVVAPGLTSGAQGLAATEGKQSGPVVFAAVGQVARYPTGVPSGGNIPSWIPLVVILLALLGGGYAVSRRSRRFGYAMGVMRNEANTGRAAQEAVRYWGARRLTAVERTPSAPASGDEQPSQGRVAAPSELTSRSVTGTPASEKKAAQNGHGKPPRRQ